jgi:hypothetical protein
MTSRRSRVSPSSQLFPEVCSGVQQENGKW